MSKYTVTYHRCNGCGKTTLDDEIRIVESRARRLWGEDDQTIDMCQECSDDDCFICHYCNSVHNESNPCEKLRGIWQETVKQINEYYQGGMK